jgi:glycosyltransferase involved in cell wall biosynthesis
MLTETPRSVAPFGLSVVVPSFNEQNTILRVLDALLSLDMPGKKLEIIVVNDGSTDDTKNCVETVDD